jgi:hypothetical protein
VVGFKTVSRPLLDQILSGHQQNNNHPLSIVDHFIVSPVNITMTGTL